MYSGRLVEKPLTYIWFEPCHSGSRYNMCVSWSLNLCILSSIEGQYLGPTPPTSPENIGLDLRLSSMMFLHSSDV